MKKYLLPVLVIALLSSCNKTSDQKNEAHDHHENASFDDKTKDMLAIHDSIMPHMDKIMELKNQVNSELKATDSLISIKSTPVLVARKEEGRIIAAALDSADHAMMGWMHGLKLDTLKTMDATRSDAYVADQKSKILEVKTQMDKSILDADQFLQKLKK